MFLRVSLGFPKRTKEKKDREGGEFKRVVFMTALAVLTVVEITLPHFACPSKYSTKRPR